MYYNVIAVFPKVGHQYNFEKKNPGIEMLLGCI